MLPHPSNARLYYKTSQNGPPPASYLVPMSKIPSRESAVSPMSSSVLRRHFANLAVPFACLCVCGFSVRSASIFRHSRKRSVYSSDVGIVIKECGIIFRQSSQGACSMIIYSSFEPFVASSQGVSFEVDSAKRGSPDGQAVPPRPSHP